MSKMFADVQPAVRKETKKVAIGTFVCVVLMWAVFGIGHLAVPEQIPFDYTVLLAGFIGGMVAVLNFFLMGLTVQKIVSMEDDKQAAAKMKADVYKRQLQHMVIFPDSSPKAKHLRTPPIISVLVDSTLSLI